MIILYRDLLYYIVFYILYYLYLGGFHASDSLSLNGSHPDMLFHLYFFSVIGLFRFAFLLMSSLIHQCTPAGLFRFAFLLMSSLIHQCTPAGLFRFAFLLMSSLIHQCTPAGLFRFAFLLMSSLIHQCTPAGLFRFVFNHSQCEVVRTDQPQEIV